MTIKSTAQNGLILRQEVILTKKFLGHRTAHVDGIAAPVKARSFVASYTRNVLDGEGLIEFAPFVVNKRLQLPLVWVSWVKIVVGTAVAWTLAATDGDGGGTADEVDDPLLDVELAAGTGNASVRVMRDFAPGEKLRFITATAVTSPHGILQVEFHPIEDLSRPWN